MPSHEEAFEETLRGLSVTTADAAAVQLGRAYARVLDGAPEEQASYVYERIGPKFQSILIELGATPRARGTKGGTVNDAHDELAAIRASRV